LGLPTEKSTNFWWWSSSRYGFRITFPFPSASQNRAY